MNENIDYKKIADDAREFSVICHGAGLKHLSGRILCYADAISARPSSCSNWMI